MPRGTRTRGRSRASRARSRSKTRRKSTETRWSNGRDKELVQERDGSKDETSRSRTEVRRNRSSSQRSSDDTKMKSRSHRSRRRRSSSEDSRKKRKSRKRRKRYRSSSSDNSRDDGPSDSEKERRRVKKGDRKKESKEERKARRKAEKEALKANETPEERYQRRLAKKHAKGATVFGYTNDNNPFGDSSLSEQFTWKKREQKRGKKESSLSLKEIRRKKQEKLSEILKVKQRRLEREEQQMERERLKDEEVRLREAQSYVDWEKDEEEFHLKQQKHRSTIRIAEGREKPIDILAKNLLVYNEYKYGTELGPDGKPIASTVGKDINLEVGEPDRVFDGLPLSELRVLREEILGYQKLDAAKEANHGKAFWAALLLVADDCIEREIARSRGIRDDFGIHGSVGDNVNEMIQGKDRRQLEQLLGEIKGKLQSQSAGVDVDYWRTVHNKVSAAAARVDLRDIHREILVASLKLVEGKRGQRDEKEGSYSPAQQEGSFSPAQQGGSFSPEMEDEPLEGSAGLLNEEEDLIQLEKQRQAIAAKRRQVEDEKRESNALEEAGGMIDGLEDDLDEDEEVLGKREEVELGVQTYQWQDKYRPRKPRYFNSVKTGFDWNKYNQTHYDQDNPPPKVVQGYKFNIFYPDLINKSVSPTFKLEPAESQDFCIIRFHAGPPYEDIAFKIVNQEWEKSRKHGFKCVFDRGNMHLYFNFKRHRYRR